MSVRDRRVSSRRSPRVASSDCAVDSTDQTTQSEETGRDYFRHALAAVGDRSMASRGGGPTGPAVGSFTSPNTGEVAIELLPSEERAYGSEDLGLLWREATAPISGSGRGRLRAEHHECGQRRRRATRRPGHRRAASRSGRGQAAPPRLRRRLRDDRLVPRRQGRDEARHQAGRRDRRPHAAESRPSGAPGVLRRGGAANPAGARRRPRDGPLSARRAALARRPSAG